MCEHTLITFCAMINFVLIHDLAVKPRYLQQISAKASEILKHNLLKSWHDLLKKLP